MKLDEEMMERARRAMKVADKATKHLPPNSEECLVLWQRVFHDTLWNRKGLDDPDLVKPAA